MLRLNIGLKACPLGKHSQTIRKNFFPRLVFTLVSKGGLYHVMFLFLFLRGFSLLYFGLNLSLYAYPVLPSAAWYIGAALLTVSSCVRRDIRQPLVYILWDSFDDVRWMVALCVYIRWYVARFHKRIVFSGVTVQGHI